MGVFLAIVFWGTYSFAQQQTQVWYSTQNLGGGRWQYTYEVSNSSLAVGIDEFTICFDYNTYKNMQIETPDPPCYDWDEIVWQPDPVFEDNGGYDALALELPIGVGESVTGFMVSFDWLGCGRPGAQSYEIIDPMNFNVIDSGITVPEPMAMLYLIIGAGWMLRNKTRQALAI